MISMNKKNKNNIVSIPLACTLHVVLFASLIFVYETSNANIPNRPLMLKASLIKEENLITPKKIEEKKRRAAEEEKRLSDIKLEKERIERNKKAEQKRIEDQKKEKERLRQEEIANKRKKEEEQEKKRVEAERKRLADIEKQRAENERIRKEIEAAEKQAQLDRELENEQKRLDAMRSGALSRYMYALMLKIENNWIQPIGAGKGLSCTVNVRQLPGGEVVSVSVTVCNGDESVRRSIEAAVYKASPLPNPEDPSLFERNLRFIFEPIQ